MQLALVIAIALGAALSLFEAGRMQRLWVLDLVTGLIWLAVAILIARVSGEVAKEKP